MVAASATMADLDTLQPRALKAIIVAQQLQLLSNDNEIEHLKLLVAKLRRMQFGRRSEKVAGQIEQLELQLEELEASRAEDAAQTESQPPASAASTPAKAPDRRRRPLPDHLPRRVHTHMPAVDNCPDCGGTLKKLGEDVSEVLEYIPASFVVIRHVRPRMCCSRCDTILQAPAPSRPVERGLAGAGLLAHVLTAKFCDHLPLFRQSDIYAREGVDLERSTLAKWVGESSKLLAPSRSAQASSACDSFVPSIHCLPTDVYSLAQEAKTRSSINCATTCIRSAMHSTSPHRSSPTSFDTPTPRRCFAPASPSRSS
jgi:transposase